MKTISVAGAAALLIATLAACGHSAPSPTPASPAATGSASSSGHTTATTTDPCQLVTAQEASALTGASYGPGTERTTVTGKTCVYGGGTKNVLMVNLWQGNTSRLHHLRDQVTAEIEQTGSTAQVNPIPVAGLGDEGTAYSVSGDGFHAASIFALKKTHAIYLVNEVTGKPAATTAALTTTARTALGRLP